MRLRLDAARRVALAAQGLHRPRPPGRRDRRHFRRLVADLGVLQLDSVNVVARSHYLPAFARLGPYDHDRLDRYLADGHEVFEYWGHEASVMPSSLHPYLRWRMAAMRPWGRVRSLLEEHPEYVQAVYDELVARGPLTVGQLSDPGSRTGPWWGHGRGRAALDWLFATGRITARRDHRFVRVWDLPERHLPSTILAQDAVPAEEAHEHLLMRAAKHHGVGTAKDLADYYRLNVPRSRPILERLAEAGRLRRVEVEGWRQPAYLHPEATRPRRVSGTALLSPFDSLIWERQRTERLFGFRYRIEIYVPERDRVHGYYVLPYLMDGALVARVDLKARREQSVLAVRAAHVEPGREGRVVAEPLARDLEAMARWLGLDAVTPESRGNLARALRRALG